MNFNGRGQVEGIIGNARSCPRLEISNAREPRCVAGPFDGHLTLIDRSTRRDGAFNRADARTRASARRITLARSRDALSAVPAT